MRKILKADGNVVSEAWIGGSAPIPDGWHLDINSAMDAKQVEPVAPPPPENADEEAPMPKRRGRPRLVK